MGAAPADKPVVHFGIPSSDAETVFHTLAAATGPYLKRLPDGETRIHKTWIPISSGRTHCREQKQYSFTGALATYGQSGTRKIESRMRYLGIEVDDALAIAEQIDV